MSVRLAVVALAVWLGSSLSIPAQASGAGIDGPGVWFVARTLTATTDPTPEMDQGCDEHFGPAAGVAVRQHALAYAVGTNAHTGFVSAETKRWLGHAFICAGLGPLTGQRDPIAAYAQAQIRGLGTIEMNGSCSLHPNPLQVSYFLGCRQQFVPQPEIGLRGGYMMQLATSGSLVSGYLVLAPGTKIPRRIKPGPEPPHGSLPNPPNFHLYRSFRSEISSGSPACRAARTAGVTGARATKLSATQPRPGNGTLDPRQVLDRDAKVTLCLGGGARARPAGAVLEFQQGGEDVKVVARGNCREVPGSSIGLSGDALANQTCDLPVESADGVRGFRGGLLTSHGLVRAGNPLRSRNSHVWTMALLAPRPPAR